MEHEMHLIEVILFKNYVFCPSFKYNRAWIRILVYYDKTILGVNNYWSTANARGLLLTINFILKYIEYDFVANEVHSLKWNLIRYPIIFGSSQGQWNYRISTQYKRTWSLIVTIFLYSHKVPQYRERNKVLICYDP